MLIESTPSPVQPHAPIRGPLRPSGWETPVRPTIPSQQNDRIQHHSKVNVVTASLLLIMCAPIFCVIIALVKLTSRGQIFFAQDRLGLHGRKFKLFKFRSMHVDAEVRLEEILGSNSKFKREYDTFHKLRNDPRVTPVGRILRRTSLDELPQLLNVVMGDINLVGPRAYLPGEVVKMNGY